MLRKRKKIIIFDKNDLTIYKAFKRVCKQVCVFLSVLIIPVPVVPLPRH